MSGPIKRVALAIREQDKATVENDVREIEYADVRRVNPLSLELHGSRMSLDEQDDLTLSQWVRSYDAQVGIKAGDTLAVKQMRSGRWLVSDVVNEEEALFEGGGTVADGSISTAKIANDAVTAAKIASGAVGSTEIASDAVTSDKIAADAVGSAEITSGAVGSSEIAADAVTADKIASGAVGSSEIADDAVTAAKLADDASTDSNRAVTTNHIRDLAVTTSKIAANAVTSAQIATDAVSSAQIATDAVTSSEIAANAVGTSELADDSVTAAKITVTYQAQTGATFTPATADMGKLIGMNSGSGQTVTINGSLDLSPGDKIDFIQLGSGQVTFAQGSGATLNGTPGLKMRAQYSAASVICVATDTYVVVGDLAA